MMYLTITVFTRRGKVWRLRESHTPDDSIHAHVIISAKREWYARQGFRIEWRLSPEGAATPDQVLTGN